MRRAEALRNKIGTQSLLQARFLAQCNESMRVKDKTLIAWMASRPTCALFLLITRERV